MTETLLNILAPLTLTCIGLIVYHHLIYPLILRALRAGQTSPPPVADTDLPFITVLVPAFNEAAVIAQKIENLAQLDYPEDRFDVMVVCDGCTDQTPALARTAAEHYPNLRLQIIECPVNRGKVATLNAAVPRAKGEIIALSDASAMVSANALRRAAGHFAGARVGVVAGTYRLREPGSAGEAAYWAYQTAVKRGEARLGAPLGVHGAFYLFRRALFQNLPPDTINDDFILPMGMVARGWSCIYDTAIVAEEVEQADLELDFARRKRISAGNMQQVLRTASLLHPRHRGVAFAFLSGKALRAFMPHMMVAALAGSAVLAASQAFFAVLFALQAIGYCTALWRHCLPQAAAPRALDAIHYLVAGHLAGLLGGTRYLLGLEKDRWHRAPAAAKPKALANSFVAPQVRFGKRLFDIVAASLGLVLGAILFPVIALAIKLDSGGPIIFSQLRVGTAWPDRTELFQMFKFRTMFADAEARTGPVWARKGDPRITRVGRFLRMARLDEIPQMFNVLRGEMSLIGPRPERPGFYPLLEAEIPFYAERTYGVRPGITGLAQVNQGYDQSIDDVRSKVLYDHAYGMTLSRPLAWLRADFFVIWRTVAVVFAGRGQ